MATVAELYQQTLGREADPGGLAYWTNLFGSDVDPTEAATFASVAAPELAARGAVAPTAAPAPSATPAADPAQLDKVGTYSSQYGPASGMPTSVSGLYQQFYGDANKDPAGLAYWQNKFGGDAINPQQASIMLKEVGKNDPNLDTGMTVEQAYKTYLGGNTDQAGIDFWKQQFGSGTINANQLSQLTSTQSGIVESKPGGIAGTGITPGQIAAAVAAYYGGSALAEGMGATEGATAAGAGEFSTALPEGAAYAAPAATTLGTVAGDTTGMLSGTGAAAGAGETAAGSGSLFGDITLGQVGSALAIAGGINSLTGGGLTKALGFGGGGTTVPNVTTTKDPVTGQPKTTTTSTDVTTPGGAVQTADPMSPYRSQLAQMYAGYLTGGNKTDITQMPGYSQYQTGVMDPALQAAQRTAAKSGQTFSGNEMLALQKTGQQGYYSFMNDYLNRLATASGATTSPATAAQLGVNQGNAQTQATSQGLGAVLTGAAGLLGASGLTSASTLSQLFGGSGSSGGATGNTYGDVSNTWVDTMSTQMPSNYNYGDPTAGGGSNLGWGEGT